MGRRSVSVFAMFALGCSGGVESAPAVAGGQGGSDGAQGGQGAQGGSDGGQGAQGGSDGGLPPDAGEGGQPSSCEPIDCPEDAPEGTCPSNWTLAELVNCPGGEVEQHCMVSAMQGWRCKDNGPPFIGVRCCCPGGECY